MGVFPNGTSDAAASAREASRVRAESPCLAASGTFNSYCKLWSVGQLAASGKQECDDAIAQPANQKRGYAE